MRWLVLVVVAACNSGSATPKVEPTQPIAPAPSVTVPALASADTATGKQHYVKLCAPCHGDDLKGYKADHAPSLVNATFQESATDAFLTQAIVTGRPGTSMGAYGKAMGGPLDDAAVASLVRYIRSQGTPSLALANVTPGDAQRGAALYNEYCKTCHGDTAIRGEAIHLANPTFQKQATDAFLRYAIEKGRPGTKMQAFGAVMKPEQLDDLVAYVRSFGAGALVTSKLPPPTGNEPLVLNPKGRDPSFTPRENRFVSVDAVAKALADGRKMIIIDARPPSDWMHVHVKGAVSIPYHDPKRLDDVPLDVVTIAYCACPHHLSGIVVDELVKRGHKRAYVLDEGINAWHYKKYPVVAAPGVQPPAQDPMAGRAQ
ncbi:MAG TPA: c-type cytochrome [Kofleriaceae bacterium]|nr:c-type cytochrome [Kofleriaceae bacterium]